MPSSQVMIRLHPGIRYLYVVMLLGVMASQWVVGGLYLKRTFLVEIIPEMNSIEKIIANKVFDKYGFQVQIAVVDEDEIGLIQGLGYAAPFVHALDIDGTAQAFTLEEQVLRYQNIEVDLASRDHDTDQQHRRLSLERLFTQFCIGEAVVLRNPEFDVDVNTFYTTHLHDIYHQSVPSPPPEVA